jgi:MtfA peptidase
MWSVRSWRRQRILRRNALSEELWRHAVADLPVLRGLGGDELARLRELTILFRHEKVFLGKGGIELDETMQLIISAQACLLILDLGLDWYDGWHSIIVYPEGFVAAQEQVDEAGVVHHVHDARVGEAWEDGPVVLSWRDILEAGDGYNVVIHEFAHKLDLLNGEFNGFPPLHPDMDSKLWSRVFSRAYDDFCQRLDAGLEPVFDPYAADSPGEFFAVLSEAFFELPQQLRAHYPHVYGQLRAFYRQDPAARLPLRAVLSLTVPS